MPAPMVGGRPLTVLTASGDGGARGEPRLLSAVIAPGRGMLLAQVRADLPGLGVVDLLTSPPLEALADVLNGGPDDAYGNAAFSLGGAILAPFANRIRGRPGPQDTLQTEAMGQSITLPRNWGGKAPGAERYAMHGLILDQPFEIVEYGGDSLTGRLDAGSFGGRWPSRTDITVSYRVSARALTLTVEAANVGEAPTPIGIGWHPYFNLLGGDRAAARLTLPARSRLEVGDYDAVLPTGRILPAEGAYDFRRGQRLGDLQLDDCFVDLIRDRGRFTVEIVDDACRLRLSTNSAGVQAVQVYAPRQQAFIVVEPQFNRPDPFAPMWEGQGGMAHLQPGQTVDYQVTLNILPSKYSRQPVSL